MPLKFIVTIIAYHKKNSNI